MFTTVRSVRATMGRMSSLAHSSMRGLVGKQKRYSVPSALRMLAIAVDPFMACAPARVRRRVDLPGMAAASARRHGLQQRLWIADDPSTDHVDELARVAYVGRGIDVEDYQIGE